MKLIVFNLKMNLLDNEIDSYIREVKNYKLDNVVFCPSAIYIKKFHDNNITVGSQDISFALQGEYTGDISILQLKSLGIKYSIVGHSERRDYYMDSRFVNKKIKLCLENNVTPILCIGESDLENRNNDAYSICIDEIDKALMGNTNIENVIISYEPIWAIGSGTIPTVEYIDEMISNIKKYVYNNYGVNIKVLYGGSVNEENIASLNRVPSIDGFLVGGCSLKTNAIKIIINTVRGE